MKSTASKLLVGLFIVFGSTTSLFSGQSCHCPMPPGGSVSCGKDQIAICDPSDGKCACSCTDVNRDSGKKQYLSVIFSKILGSNITPTQLNSPEYNEQINSFVASGHEYTEQPLGGQSEKAAQATRDCSFEGCRYVTFVFHKKDLSGKEVEVNVSAPEWLASVLKNPL